MRRIRIAPIVEGHGEVAAVRPLLQRVWTELLGEAHADVLQPVRGHRKSLVREEELCRAVQLALFKLAAATPVIERSVVLILLDADEDAPCVLAPQLLDMARRCRPDVDVACVLANVQYETWFVAAAESLASYLDLSDGHIPLQPESSRQGAAWIAERFTAGNKYSKPVDQPRLTAAMDLKLCRSRSLSFDKLCRELEARRA